MAKQKPVLPFYGVAALWIGYAFLFPLYLPGHFIFLAALSLAAFFLLNGLCRGGTAPAAETAKEPEKQEKPASTGNPELDKMVKDGSLAIAELKRLDENIADPGISADIVRLEQVSGKIFEEVKRDPKKLSQIQRFMDYYLPTTLKLLNAYDRASSTGISGENVDATKAKVEQMLNTLCSAFDKQLDALFSDEALDVSTDITVMENLLAQEGLSSPSAPTGGMDGPTLEL